MQFPPRAQEIIHALYELHLPLARGSEEDRRLLTRTIAEQICFELGPLWGCKKASPSRPQSKDSIAFNAPSGMVTFDWQNGSTREPLVPPRFWSADELTRTNGGFQQVFIPVTPADHLGVKPEPPAMPPPISAPPAPAPTVVPSLSDYHELLRRLNLMESRIIALENKSLPRYVATFFGIKLVSVPER
jgi:hypothetical protein